MPIRRGVSPVLVMLLVGLALAIGAPTASAVSLDKVSGGQSAIFVPFSTIQKLGHAGIFVSPTPPAFLDYSSVLEGPSVRFPVSGGAVESATMLGPVNHAGGLLIQKYGADGTVETELRVTDPKIVNGISLVGNALGLIPAPTADLVNASHSKTGSVITYEADAQIGAATALVLNTYFSTDAFEGGMLLGRLKSTIQTKRLLL